MKKTFLILCMTLIAATAYGFGKDAKGCGQDCSACHKVSKEEIVALLKDTLTPGVEITGVSTSPVGGLYQVIVKKGMSFDIIYIDFAKKHLIKANILELQTRKNVTSNALEKSREDLFVDLNKIPLDNALVMGNKKGSKKIIVFSDPECAYCKKLHDESLLPLAKEDPEFVAYIILMPIHQDSVVKNQSIICRSKKNMDEAIKMLESSYNGKEVKKFTCDNKDYAGENNKIAKELGVASTPTIVLSSGKVVIGYMKKDDLKKVIDGDKK